MWWSELTTFCQISFIVAVTSTAILGIYLFLVFTGIDSPTADNNANSGGANLYSDEPTPGIFTLKIINFRSILVLFAVGAWVAYFFYPMFGWVWTIVSAVLLGVGAAILVAWLYQKVMKLEPSDDKNYIGAIGKTAVVYIRVPKQRSGKGKVTVTLQDKQLEIDAITDELEDLVTNSFVHVVDLADDKTLIVSKAKAPEEE